jgi:adenylosuccinate synthase
MLPGWREPLDDKLPAAARSYVEFVESALELEVSMIGTGADRESVITRDQPAYSRS